MRQRLTETYEETGGDQAWSDYRSASCALVSVGEGGEGALVQTRLEGRFSFRGRTSSVAQCTASSLCPAFLRIASFRSWKPSTMSEKSPSRRLTRYPSRATSRRITPCGCSTNS